MSAEASSAMDVAAAAPDGPTPFARYDGAPNDDDDAADTAPPPLPSPKMKRGSRAKFSRFVVRLTLSGVTVFNMPRYAAKPVLANNARTIPPALHRR